MGFTDAQQAALYYARKRRRMKTARIGSVTDLSVVEGATNGTVVGQLEIVPLFGVPVWTLSDDADGRFALSASGQLTVADGGKLIHATNASHDIAVSAADPSRNLFTRVLTVQVTEAP
jgi:hypothetical protein